MPVNVMITPGFDGDSWHADRHFSANGSDKGSAGSANGYASGEKYGTHERDSLNVSEEETARVVVGSCCFTNLSIFRGFTKSAQFRMLLRQETVSSLCNPPNTWRAVMCLIGPRAFFVADPGRSETMTEETVFIERRISHYSAVLKLDLDDESRANGAGLLGDSEQNLTKATVAARDLPVVCVGGSAGGLDACTRLLRHLPSDMGVAIVIVNHLRSVSKRLKAKLKRLIFIDETSTKTNMVRLRGRSRRGKRLVDKATHGHWKTSTFIAALRHNRLTAPFTIDGAVNGEVFLAYVRRVLVQTLKNGDIVIMDNLGSHKIQGIREALRAAGATLLFVPPYSPDQHPQHEVPAMAPMAGA